MEDAGTTVVVSATVTAQTFFSRRVLLNVQERRGRGSLWYRGRAAGGALPIAFDEPTYNNSTLLPCSEQYAASGKFTIYMVGSTLSYGVRTTLAPASTRYVTSACVGARAITCTTISLHTLTTPPR